jgi:hypothetical protein
MSVKFNKDIVIKNKMINGEKVLMNLWNMKNFVRDGDLFEPSCAPAPSPSFSRLTSPLFSFLLSGWFASAPIA